MRQKLDEEEEENLLGILIYKPLTCALNYEQMDEKKQQEAEEYFLSYYSIICRPLTVCLYEFKN